MRTLLVYFHSFCTSVLPTSNLMSSQRPIFNWLTDQTIQLLSISVSFLSVFLFLHKQLHVVLDYLFLQMSCRGKGVQNSQNLLCVWPTTQRVYVCWNFAKVFFVVSRSSLHEIRQCRIVVCAALLPIKQCSAACFTRTSHHSKFIYVKN